MNTAKQSIIASLIIIFKLASSISFAQDYQTELYHEKSDFSWPKGKLMGLSLTFDDGRTSQVDNGIPLLDKYGVTATFYLSPENMMMRIDEWKNALSNGHDIGNHSFFHPCSGNFPFARDRALENYTLDQMRVELDSASKFMKEILGIHPVSFAYPCGQTFVGRGVNTKSYIPVVASMFQTGRGWLNEGPNDPTFCDMAQITGMKLDGKSFEEILVLIEGAKKRGQWLVLAGHDIHKTGTGLTTFLDTLEEICKYAKDPTNGIWIDNVHNIASYVIEQRKKQF